MRTVSNPDMSGCPVAEFCRGMGSTSMLCDRMRGTWKEQREEGEGGGGGRGPFLWRSWL